MTNWADQNGQSTFSKLHFQLKIFSWRLDILDLPVSLRQFWNCSTRVFFKNPWPRIKFWFWEFSVLFTNFSPFLYNSTSYHALLVTLSNFKILGLFQFTALIYINARLRICCKWDKNEIVSLKRRMIMLPHVRTKPHNVYLDMWCKFFVQ